MEAEEIGRELVRQLLKPPIQLVATSPGTLPEEAGIRCGKTFNSVDEAYAFFRQKRPEGRWLVWVQSSDGQVMSLDSKKWEEAMGSQD